MRLTKLKIGAFPGVNGSREYELSELITVITGPNASGKSSTARALFSLFSPSLAKGEIISVSGTFTDGADEYIGERSNDRTRWRKNGQRHNPTWRLTEADVHTHFLTVKDLLEVSSTEDELIERVLVELTGGVDIKQIVDSLTPKGRSKGQVDARNYAGAQKKVRDLELEREKLVDQEENLGEKHDLLKQFDEQLERKIALEAANEYRAIELQLHSHEATRELLPTVYESLTPERIESLNTQLDRYDDLQAEIDDLIERVTKLDAELAHASNVPDATTTLRRMLDLQDEINDVQQHIHVVNARSEAARARYQHISEYQGDIDSDYEAPIPAELTQLYELVQHVYQCEQRLESLQRDYTRVVAQRDDAERAVDGEEAEQLERERNHVEKWMDLQADRRFNWPFVIAAVTVVLAVALALTLSDAATDLLLTPTTLGLAAVIIAGFVVAATNFFQERKKVSEQNTLNEVMEPVPQSIDDARWRLKDYDNRLAEHHKQTQHAAELGADSERLQMDITHTAQQHTDLDADLQSMAAKFRVPVSRPMDVAMWVQHTQDIASAREEMLRTSGELEALQRQIATYEETKKAELQPFAFASQPSKRELEHWLSKEESFARARNDRATTTSTLKREQDNAEKLWSTIVTSVTSLGVAAEDVETQDDIKQVITQQRARWGAYQAFVEKKEAFKQDLAQQRILARREPSVLELSTEQLREQLAALPEIRAKRVELHDDIALTKAKIDEAQKHRNLESAQHEEQRTHQVLEDHRFETLKESALTFVYEEVVKAGFEQQEPQTLRQAAKWFTSFTLNRFELHYELTLDESARSALMAKDTERNVVLPLNQLSSGTLSQLLLAARIAYALERESSGIPAIPFVLDEALGTSDNDRIAAVAENLALFSRETQRQLLYLSARQEDVQVWQRIVPTLGVLSLLEE